jgi:hypothetical protein
LALGSSRGRLLRLWLIECLALSLAAGALGLVFASWLVNVAAAFKLPTMLGEPDSPALPLTFTLDLRVFAFTLGISMLTALTVGLFTGLQGTRPGLLAATRSGRVSDRRFAPGFNLRSAVIALQMALSLTLLIPCGLMVRSWMNASVVPPGFATDHVLLLPISANAVRRARQEAGRFRDGTGLARCRASRCRSRHGDGSRAALVRRPARRCTRPSAGTTSASVTHRSRQATSTRSGFA